MNFVNEKTNERKSIISQAWIHHPRVSSRNICKCRIASIITLFGLKTATARNSRGYQNLSTNNTPCINTGRHTEKMSYRHGQPNLTHTRCSGDDPSKNHIKVKRYSQKPNIFSWQLFHRFKANALFGQCRLKMRQYGIWRSDIPAIQPKRAIMHPKASILDHRHSRISDTGKVSCAKAFDKCLRFWNVSRLFHAPHFNRGRYQSQSVLSKKPNSTSCFILAFSLFPYLSSAFTVVVNGREQTMAGCLEARVGGPGRTRTCNNTVMSRGF